MDRIKFSDYLETINLTDKVLVPEHGSETMTDSDLKYLLQQAFGLLLDEHLEQHSLGGLFSFKDYVISRKSKTMRLQSIHRFAYTTVSGQTDRDRFAENCEDLFGGKRNVPMDVYVWLDCIKRGVDGCILRRHINMRHRNETFGAFLTLYDAFMDLPSHHKETFKALPAMQVYKQWPVYTFKWSVLKQSLQNQAALIRAREEEARSMSTGANNNELMEEAYKDDLQGLLTFINDTFEYQAREYKEYMLPVMLMEYKAFLADLQEGLYLYGKLPQLKH